MSDSSAVLWAIKKDSWIAYADCEVAYVGRAVGLLAKSSYLILRKPDGSVSIQGGDLNQARNYIRSTKVEITENVIIFSDKKEKLKIKVHKLHWLQYISGWGTNKVELYRTEKQLVEKFAREANDHIPGAEFMGRVFEYRLPGTDDKVDLAYVNDDNKIWLVEVKRRAATTKDVTQILRYGDHMLKDDPATQMELLLVAPRFSDNAIKFANGRVQFIQLDWDELPSKFVDI